MEKKEKQERADRSSEGEKGCLESNGKEVADLYCLCRVGPLVSLLIPSPSFVQYFPAC